MEPPPATPSPRRFLTKNAAASATGERSTVKPTSNLRFSNTSATSSRATGNNANAAPQPSIRPTSSHGQFNATPKFAFAQPNKRHDTLLISPKKPAVAPKFDGWNGRDDKDVIEDGWEETGVEDDEMILETTEAEEFGHDEWPPSPKRQRRSLDDTPSSRILGPQASEDAFPCHPTLDMQHALPPPSPFSVKQTPARQRFVFTQPAVAPSLASGTPFAGAPNAPITRPTFLKPPAAPSETAEPLPEAFSPHRRGQKFLTGGMAAEVRQWIIDASQAPQTRKFSGDVLRVRVMESRGSAKDGVVLVRGSVEGKEVKLMLPGAGKSRTYAALTTGEVVAVKAPTWDVDVDGETWIVAADWRAVRD